MDAEHASFCARVSMALFSLSFHIINECPCASGPLTSHVHLCLFLFLSFLTPPTFSFTYSNTYFLYCFFYSYNYLSYPAIRGKHAIITVIIIATAEEKQDKKLSFQKIFKIWGGVKTIVRVQEVNVSNIMFTAQNETKLQGVFVALYWLKIE